MALDLQTAKQLIQQRGVQPPPGADFDTWAMQWLQGAVDAGDPAAVKAVGGTTEEEVDPEAGGGGIAPWQDAAGPEEWMGKRMPTPREYRKWANMEAAAGRRSEDFARYPDRVVANWLKSGDFDINTGLFAGGVEKPTETGGKLAPKGGGGGGAGRPAPQGPTPGGGVVNPDLQQRLVDQFRLGGGIFGSDPNRRGVSLQGGGMIWGVDQPEARAGLNPADPGAMTNAPGAGALASATLNAFSPQAPSKQATTAFSPMPNQTPAPQPAAPATATPSWQTPQPTTRTSPLTQSLSRQYRQPNAWWMSRGNQPNYSY